MAFSKTKTKKPASSSSSGQKASYKSYVNWAAKQTSKGSRTALEQSHDHSAMGELQTIPARHGTATFVPEGHSIKIINTYGKQVVDTWAFALHAPPSPEDKQKAEEQKGEADEQEQAQSGADDKEAPKEEEAKEEEPEKEVEGAVEDTKEKAEDTAQEAGDEVKEGAEETADQAKGAAEGAKKEGEKAAGGWTSYIPSIRSKPKKLNQGEEKKEAAPKPTEKKGDEASNKGNEASKTWSQYLMGSSGPQDAPKEKDPAKGWSSYIPSGQGFSAYIPTSDKLSGFASSHYRDPDKSLAEQLYNFSKTPVGSAGLSRKQFSMLQMKLYADSKSQLRLDQDTAVLRTPPIPLMTGLLMIRRWSSSPCPTPARRTGICRLVQATS